ncbi:MAG TPA: hypothetical protein ENL03_02525 [Phycisphaerae bacterium]|nr:hypothetical protein [Phycisphaerae bacterium]
MIRHHKLRYLSAVAILVLVVSISVTSFAQETSPVKANAPAEVEAPKPTKVDLAVKYPAGKWVLECTHKSDSSTAIDNVDEESQKIDLAMLIDLDIAKADAKGLTTMKLSFRSFVITVKNGQNKTKFDSAPGGEKNRFLAKLFTPMMQVGIVVKLDSTGKCVEIKGLEKLWDDVKEGNERLRPMLNNIEKFLGDMFGSGGTGQLTPSKPVELSEKWIADITRESRLGGKISGKFDCSLDSVEATTGGNLAVVAFSGKLVQAEGTERELQLANALVKIRELESSQNGKMKIYTDSHRPGFYFCTVSTKIDMVVVRHVDRVVMEKNVSVSKMSEVNWKLTKFVKPGEKPEDNTTDKPAETDVE